MKETLSETGIIDLRRKDNFLPYYSDLFFEQTKYFIRKDMLTGMIILTYILIFCSLGISRSFLLVLFVIWTIYVFLLIFSRPLVNQLQQFGYTFWEDGFEKYVWGKTTKHTYSEIYESLQSKKVIISNKKFLVPHNNKKISFPYEIGNAAQQNHVQDCYKYLSKKLEGKLPEYKISSTGKFDRAYVYQRSFSRCIIVLIVLVIAIITVSLNLYSEVTVCLIDIMIAIVHCCVMTRLIKSAYLGEENSKKIKKEFEKVENVEIRIRYHRTWEAILISLITIAIQLIIFFVLCY